MNEHLWRELFITIYNPVYYQRKQEFSFSGCCRIKYPALTHLQDNGDVQIAILAYLILKLENEDREDQLCSEIELVDLFNTIAEKQVIQALSGLIKQGYLDEFVDESTGEFYYSAAKKELVEKCIYIRNDWGHLDDLGLYGNKISKS